MTRFSGGMTEAIPTRSGGSYFTGVMSVVAISNRRRSANLRPFDPGAEATHWSDIAVEDDFGFGVRSSKEVS